MREFVYYSKSAVTSGNLIKDNLKQAGRMDIVCNVIISTFFISNMMREDVKLHLLFDGQPNPPKHLILQSNKDMPISKKDIAGLIKRMLYKSENKEELKEIYPGCFIEKKSFEKLINELNNSGKNIFLLDKKGKNLREFNFKGNEVFIIGDHDGFPKDKSKFLKRIDKISVSPKTLFASQVITLVHNEIDFQE
ncbi:MAG: tRNA (pseudouridine(54)-N(1))-methyltransferase TrmY [Candidatus Pacearchaeota archaeon]